MKYHKIILIIALVAVIFVAGCVGKGGGTVSIATSGVKEAAKFYSFDTTSFKYRELTENVRKLLLVHNSPQAAWAGEVDWVAESGGVQVIKAKKEPGVALLRAVLGSTYDKVTLTTMHQGILVYGQEKVVTPVTIEPTNPWDVASTSRGARVIDRCVYPSCNSATTPVGQAYETRANAAVDDLHPEGYWSSCAIVGTASCQITIDLGTVRENLNEIRTHLYDYDGRYYYGYAIELSTDKISWTKVVYKRTTVKGRVTDTFAPTDARYIKYIGYGNTVNEGLHLTEVDAYQSEEVPEPTPTPEEEIDESKTGYAIVDGRYLLVGSVSGLKRSIEIYKSGTGTFESKVSRYTSAVSVKDIFTVQMQQGGIVIGSIKVRSEYFLSEKVAVEKAGDYLKVVNTIEGDFLKNAIKYTRKDKTDFVVFEIPEISPSKSPTGFIVSPTGFIVLPLDLLIP